MTELLSLDRASFALPGMSAARAVSLSVHAGELVVVTGPEGTGKSTLLRGVLGLAAPDGGSAALFGVRVGELAHDQWMALRARCAYASWTAPLLANLTLYDNLAVPLFMRSISERDARPQVERMLARFGLADVAARLPQDLRGDTHRLALLARALLLPAELMLIDDPPESAAADEALEAAAAQGAGVLVSTRRADRFPRARHVQLQPEPAAQSGENDALARTT